MIREAKLPNSYPTILDDDIAMDCCQEHGEKSLPYTCDHHANVISTVLDTQMHPHPNEPLKLISSFHQGQKLNIKKSSQSALTELAPCTIHIL